jgi:hypothetical protein
MKTPLFHTSRDKLWKCRLAGVNTSKMHVVRLRQESWIYLQWAVLKVQFTVALVGSWCTTLALLQMLLLRHVDLPLKIKLLTRVRGCWNIIVALLVFVARGLRFLATLIIATLCANTMCYRVIFNYSDINSRMIKVSTCLNRGQKTEYSKIPKTLSLPRDLQ